MRSRAYCTIFFSIIIACSFACGKMTIRTGQGAAVSPQGALSEKERNAHFFSCISAINEKAPTLLSTQLIIEGTNKNKKFKALGELAYDKSEGRMTIAFVDIIFKSPITYIFIEKNAIKLYFPVEKKLFIDDTSTMKIKHYADFSIDFNIIYSLVRGMIPLIPEYRLKELTASPDKHEDLLVLENDSTYQTICFDQDRPNKMLLINKMTMQKYELNFAGIENHGESWYFKDMKLSAIMDELKIDIAFRNTRINIPVKVKTIEEFGLRKDIQIIQMSP